MKSNHTHSSIIRNCFITADILALSSLICMLLQRFSSTDTHVPLLFVLAVLAVSRFTSGYVYGIIASLLAVIGVNYAFTYPYFELNFTLTGYPLTFFVMLSVSLMVCTMTSRIKMQEHVHLEMETEKMRNNLLRSVSHDLRTPLTSIRGNASALLENDGKLSSQQKQSLLEDIRNESEWLTHVVENILFITKLINGSGIRTTPELAEEIASSAINKIRRRYPDVHVSVHVPDDVLLIPMDAVLVEQVLVNLMENSVLHGRKTSHIDLTVYSEDNSGVFTVDDDGCGISEDLMPHILDGMLPVSSQDSSQIHNMGMGLSICRSIINAHGGKMWAENRSSGGARFAFSLPLEEPQNPGGNAT